MAHLPKYEKVKKQLLFQLRTGVYQTGERIPTREELIAEFGVTRTTINQALRELVDCGVLATSRRGGTVYTGQQPPRRVLIVSHLGRLPQEFENSNEQIEVALFRQLLYHAHEFHLEFVDSHRFKATPENVERCDCLVAVMPDDDLLERLQAFGDRVLFINRYGDKLNFISTPHRAAVRELVAANLEAAGKDPQLFFLGLRNDNFVERERRAGFIDECANRSIFYRICDTDSRDCDKIETVLDELPINPDRPVLMCAPSMNFTGAVIRWARRRKLQFGRNFFYSDFDNLQARRNTGEEIASVGQDYATMGKELYQALRTWGDAPVRVFVDCLKNQ